MAGEREAMYAGVTESVEKPAAGTKRVTTRTQGHQVQVGINHLKIRDPS